ncbi:Tetratricopeptide repeat protein [Rubrivivax sp. A210]|uniref:O-linked N-acetylglucosamine transferase, SPINDLY family protein n=1 Tax=Rubrivivax sp. A210 TaxID=2772301 RepID=UPI00191B2FFC|nr:tetratricopeptide repeat protein [Rubrivivax sp. A210]CAD5369110.1 Tetratricopeptide repeat protein [Rubrivivax sp. A210]
MDAVLAPDKPVTAPVTPLERARSGRMPLAELLGHANAMQAAGQPGAAAGLYEIWIAHTESALRHVACFNWGTMLSGAGQNEAAEAAYRQTLDLAPGFAPALLNLGHLLERRGDAEGALALWLQVYDAQPLPAEDLRLHALNNSARLLEMKHRYPEAEALMRRSLEIKAAQFDVIQHYVHIRQKQCAWPHDLPVGEVTPNQFLMGTSLLAMMGLSDDPALQLLAAQRFVAERVPKAPAVPLHQQIAGAPREGRIRVAYLSGDLHMHAVGLLTPELFELHDRSRFEVWGFCWTPDSMQPQRQRILKALDHHVRLAGVDDATAARLIAEAGIDVLVDLQGLTSGARPAILGYRAAPVQVSYLGLPGTSALPGVDWMLADRVVMPPELLRYCTEKPIYLPHCYQVSDRQREVAPLPDRARYGLPEDAFVYCSFNNNHKFTAEMFEAWMRILAQVPNSVLWLLADNDTAHQNMLRAAGAHGVARERLILAPRVAPAEYLARFTLADLMLDTFPFNAGTTASDALWMGLPIVTRAGRTYISRMAASLLTAIGLPDLVTDNVADYEKLAVAIGRQPLRATSYKRYLAEQGRRSPLFDVPQIVRDIETEFERLALKARAS